MLKQTPKMAYKVLPPTVLWQAEIQRVAEFPCWAPFELQSA